MLVLGMACSLLGRLIPVAIEPGPGPIWLSLTGPAGVKAFAQERLEGQVPHPPPASGACDARFAFHNINQPCYPLGNRPQHHVWTPAPTLLAWGWCVHGWHLV